MMSLADAAAVLGARTSGGDARFEGVSTDTRSISAAWPRRIVSEVSC